MNNIPRRVHLYYIVSKYLSGMVVGDTVDLAGIEVTFKWSDNRETSGRHDKFLVRSPDGWRAIIYVDATSWGYVAGVIRCHPAGTETEDAIDYWLRRAAERQRS
jgi:hypothetical protein